MELERLVFFTDAVVAIAITLLVVQFSVPAASEDVGDALLDRWPAFLSFILSFFVIGIFWMAHHRIFKYVARIDQRLIWLDLLFLMCIAFLPYPTAVLGDHDKSRAAVIFYAAAVGATGSVLALMWWYLIRAGHLTERATPSIVEYLTRRSLVTPISFLGSIPLSFVSLRLAEACWFAPFVLIGAINVRHQAS
jgi:TMEM175 potassium channel family protein